MSNFYGRCFLSSLLGALSVLSSSVASAVGGKLGKGNLKGKVGSSAGRSKNGGKGGKLEVNRKVKSVNGLKEVLKETGGKVVRVSPDGKGGFVAFVKTPTGKVVTVAIVGVSLLAIITFLVFNGRKNDGAKEMSEEKRSDILNEIDNDEKSSEIIVENTVEKKNPGFVVKNANGGLLDSLFKGSKDRYNLFVGGLFSGFFNDPEGVLKEKFDDCGRDLDEFLKVVLEGSTFDGLLWKVDGLGLGLNSALLSWKPNPDESVVAGFGLESKLKGVLGYLCGNGLVKVNLSQASFGDNVSAVLFGYWCFVEFGLGVEDDAKKVESKLKEQNINKLRDTFNIIKSYVGERLKDVNRGYDGQELKKAKS